MLVMHLNYSDARNFMGQNAKGIATNNTGSIHVHADTSGNDAFIQATKHSGLCGRSETVRVSYTQNTDANTITVNVDGQSDFVDLSRVNFDVTIPSTATLQLKTATGSIAVSGVSERWSSHAIPGQLTCVMAQ